MRWDEAKVQRRENGSLVRLPPGFRPGWDPAWAFGGPKHRRCSRCRDVALRDSDLCRHHDPTWPRRRAELVAKGKRKPSKLAETRGFRCAWKERWRHNAWQLGQTIWFGPRIEARFEVAMAQAGLPLATLSPATADTARWLWRRTSLNHDDQAGWQQAVGRLRHRRAVDGPPPVRWTYQAPSPRPPDSRFVKVVTAGAGPFDPARVNRVVARSDRLAAKREAALAAKVPAPVVTAAYERHLPRLCQVFAGNPAALVRLERHQVAVGEALLRMEAGDHEPWAVVVSLIKGHR